MNDRVCSSCGSVNTGANVYCNQCGGILGNLTAEEAQPLPATKAVAKRRQVRIEADRPRTRALLLQLKWLFFYLLWVAVGVIVVLSLMTPKDQGLPSQDIPNARDVLRKVVASANFNSGVLSQTLINSCLSQQGSLTWESPVKLIPMPVWELSRVEIGAGKLALFSTITIAGRPVHFSETFRLEKVAGFWNLVPVSATVGLLDLPGYFLPVIKMILRPGFESFAGELETLSTCRNLAMRPGVVEFSNR